MAHTVVWTELHTEDPTGAEIVRWHDSLEAQDAWKATRAKLG